MTRTRTRFRVPELDPPEGVDLIDAVPVYSDAPEHFRRVYDVKRGEPVTRFVGRLAPRVIDLLEHVVAGADVGIVLGADDERESFAVLRLRDWESIEQRAVERGARQ